MMFDTPFKGAFYTWNNKQSGDDAIWCKLDRVVTNMEFIHSFKEFETEFLNLGSSDHSPMILTIYKGRNSGPKPFKFFNSWSKEKDFLDIVKEAWATNITCTPMFILTKKLNNVKAKLIPWAKERFQHPSSQVQTAKQSLHIVQSNLQLNPICSNSRHEERKAMQDYIKASNHHESSLRLKARIKRYAAGDDNTKFFFDYVKERRARNAILSIYTSNGRKLEDDQQIAQECISHFTNLYGSDFSDPYTDSWLDDTNPIQLIDPHEAETLEAMVTENEIIQALADMDSDSSHGIDGFISHFFKTCWHIIKRDFLRAIKDFFKHSKRLGQVNNIIITLIPKVINPNTLDDYRPISCCNVTYKCISKIITLRMKKVIKNLVRDNQSAFIKGRRIQDNILLAHELVRNYHRSNGSPKCTTKIDLKKAYDMLRWEAINDILSKFGFLPKFNKWIMVCIYTTKFSISLNGSLKGLISAKRGIRQGCPLSPYLFVLVMEMLSFKFDNKVTSNDYHLHPRCVDPRIIHIYFADDLLAFFKGNVSSARALHDILSNFKQGTGLQANLNKSLIFYAGVNNNNKTSIQNVLGFREGTLPVTYLGLPLISTRLKHQDCLPVLDKMHKRINSWKIRHLPYAGRVVLAKVVLQSLHLYWTSSFSLPKSIIKAISSCITRFIWSGNDANITKKVMIKWSRMSLPYEEGGLVLRDILTSNEAAVLRYVWGVVAKNKSLWSRWVNKNLIKNKSFWTMTIPSEASWSWRNILKARDKAANIVCHIIGNGSNTEFWNSPWHPSGILNKHFPIEFRYDSIFHANVKVSCAMSDSSWNIPLDINNAIPNICRWLPHIQPDISREDKVVWIVSQSGKYTMRDTYNAIRPSSPSKYWHSLVWFKKRVPRYSFITWLALQKSLKTQDKLAKWGYKATSSCLLCFSSHENESHLFGDCHYSKFIWSSLLFMLGNVRSPLSWEQEVEWCEGSFSGKNHVATLKKITFNAYIYYIWGERNLRMYENRDTSATSTLNKIVIEIKLKIQAMQLRVEDCPAMRHLFDRWNVDIQYSLPSLIKCSWSKPPSGLVKINTDGSVNTSNASFASIIRNDRGEPLHIACGSSLATTAPLTELQGIELGLILALHHHLVQAALHSDSTMCIAYINKTAKIPWYFRNMVARIHMLANQFQYISFSHAYRETNMVADSLSKIKPGVPFLQMDLFNINQATKDLIFDDARGKTYIRHK